MLRSRLFIPLILFTAACAPALRPLPPLPPLAPLPEPPPESPIPAEARTAGESREIDRDLEELHYRGLLVPIAGIDASKIPNSFSDARDGQRKHNAIDIFAKRGTPVLSADDGTILKVGTNTLGGNIVWAVDAHRRFVYYYAHLDRWADGLRDGMSIQRGDVLGYVGTTGNAPKNIPHLHFQLLRYTNDKRYYDGPPINPLPFFIMTTSTTR
jgi:murein DD-endopeptidase MepM/ murein hydrolase activator NlpD